MSYDAACPSTQGTYLSAEYILLLNDAGTIHDVRLPLVLASSLNQTEVQITQVPSKMQQNRYACMNRENVLIN